MYRGAYNFTYEAHSSLEWHTCFYCGQYADTVDHVPPISLFNFYSNYYRVLLKSCGECNSALGGKFLPTPLVRVEFLIKKYKKRYRKILCLPSWHKEEINDLSGSLKKYIESQINMKALTVERLKYLESTKDELLSGF